MQGTELDQKAEWGEECQAPSVIGGLISERLKNVIGARTSNVSAVRADMTAQVNRELKNLAARFPEMGWDFLTPEDIQYNLLCLVDLCERLEACRYCPGLGSCKISYTVVRSAKISPPDDRWHNGRAFVTPRYGPCRVARDNMHTDRRTGRRVWNEGTVR